MGIFKFFKNVKDLDRISTSYRNIQKKMDTYETLPHKEYLFIAAWICRIGVLDIIEKNNWPPIYEVRVPSENGYYKFTLAEIRIKSAERIIIESRRRGEDVSEYIMDIFEKGDAFYEVEKQIPEAEKQFILNNKLL